ncbi:MAG: hypothetical protein WBD95_00990, partial [Xanthobacteraceae bacterium]
TGHGGSRRPRSFASRFCHGLPHATCLNLLGVVYQTAGHHERLPRSVVQCHGTPVHDPGQAAFLNQHGLSFHGFELEPAIIERFLERYPSGEALTNLDYWHEFETANPDTFWHMYVFTVSRNERVFPEAGPIALPRNPENR